MAQHGISVGVKLSLVASCMALVLITGLTGTLLRREQTKLLFSAERAVSSYGLAAHEAMTPHLDVFALHYATHEALKTPGVSQACVIDAAGRVLSDSDAKRIGTLESVPIPAANGIERRAEGSGWEIVARIARRGSDAGVVRARLTRESMDAALRAARRDVYILAGLAGLFNVLGIILIMGRELGHVRARLGRFVNSEVAETVVDGGIRLEGRLCDASVLFTDLRGFTRFSEKLPPTEVLRMLNDYFEPMVAVVERHGGWVDKFMGDGMLAVFGERRDAAGHAERAAACALELRECLARLNVVRRQGGEAALRLGMAINSGPVISGTVGSKSRLDFTVIGDTVNVASRLEGLNARLGTDLLVTRETHERTRASFAYEDLGELSVRGHDAPVRTYRLIGRAGTLAPSLTAKRPASYPLWA